jgi:xylulose-5-phosphate/fructose-6-phosphate phosphoketolase
MLGHWGTTPGLNFIYVQLNRVIKKQDLNMIYIIGPGHGGPAIVANTFMEGSYTDLYPDVSQDAEGIKKLIKHFSFPGGIPSHVAPEVPGSIHEGGELGYAVSHAYEAVFDNPDLIVACIVGDGEAETGPLATAWHSNKFLNPVRDGSVLLILHLNGYKIANPTIFDRMDREELKGLFVGYGHKPDLVALPYEGCALKGSINKAQVTGKGFLTGGHTRNDVVFYINREIEQQDINIIDVGSTIISLLGINENRFDGRCVLGE